MERIFINNLHDCIDKEVTIAGWVDVRRDHGKLIFIDLRDMTGVLQMVSRPDNEDVHKLTEEIRPEWVLSVVGTINKRPDNMVNKEVETGDIELVISSIEVLSRARELPFDRDEHLNFDTYLDYLPLVLRGDRGKAIFKVQAVIIESFRSFYRNFGFTEIQAPKLVGSDAEGGALVFELDYFGNIATLAQSPQFYKQIMVGVYERVFSTGNVFRAEKHATSRHLNEYTSLDMEMGFIKDHHDIMKVATDMVRFIDAEIRNKCEKEFALLNAHCAEIPKEIPHMKLREAQKMIKKEFGEDCTDEPDLDPQHERLVSEYAKKRFNSDFIFVTHFPKDKRPMYTYEDKDDPGYTKGFDLLFRGIELLTGSQRVHDYDTLVNNIKERGLEPEKFSFYLQSFKYGMPPHGGFGMGLERYTAKYLGLENVKEAALFPREINRIDTRLSG